MICQEHESAYWDGAKGVCCDGSVYQPDIEDTSYACCPTGKEVSIVQGKENLNHCCSEGQKAYWNGSSAQCCATSTHQIVTNYINGQTETAYACCKVEEDKSWTQTDSSDCTSIYHLSGYSVVGAVDGNCCGGYTQDNVKSNAPDLVQNTTYSYQILENGGVYYCPLIEKKEITNSTGTTEEHRYVYESPSKRCLYAYGRLMSCKCSSRGDPANGSFCS